MTLVSIQNSNLTVDPARVESVVVDTKENTLLIKMFSGDTHTLRCRYQRSIFATYDEVVGELRAGLPEPEELL